MSHFSGYQWQFVIQIYESSKLFLSSGFSIGLIELVLNESLSARILYLYDMSFDYILWEATFWSSLFCIFFFYFYIYIEIFAFCYLFRIVFVFDFNVFYFLLLINFSLFGGW